MITSLQKRSTGLVIAFLLIAGLQSNATNEIVLNASGSNSTTVIENTFYKLQVSNTINSFNTLVLSSEKGDFVELMAASYSKSNTAGAPQLPVLSKMIEIPAGATPEVNVISSDVKEYKLADFGIFQKLMPAQLPQPKSGAKVPFSYNQQLYGSNSFYAEPLARVDVAGYLRSVQLANLIISPVEYNPVTNTIRVYTNLVVEIKFTGADKAKSDEIKAKTYSPYFSSVFKEVLNYQPVDAPLDTLSKFPVKYIIVSDPMFQSALQPFINWKIKRGFDVIEAYTNDPAVGNSFNSIKAWLKNLYNSSTPANPAPTFVLFVGDVAQIPTYNCGAHVSDLYYCEFSGDYLPEMYYGRFSANNLTELQPQLNKTLQYEQYLMPDPSYLNEVVMAAGADASHQLTWGNGQINYGTDNYFNAAHNMLSHTYLQPEPSGGNYSQNIRTNISNGVAFANYTAHGSSDGWADPSFSIANIASLQNADKYGLIVGNCCQTNTYNQNTFGEVLLRAENKGAVGYIGASDYSYWDEDYWWGVGNGSIVSNPTYQNTDLGAYDRTFHDHGEPRSEWYSTMDQMIFAGNLAVQESNSGMKQYYWEIYCLMGDPSTLTYFAVPPALTVNYLPFIPLGTPTFEVQTEPYAYVAISKNNILHGVAEADATGLAIVNLLPFTDPGFANIVITKQNRKPYIDSVLVASPSGPYLLLNNYQIKDNGGNNNQIPEFNEPLTVDLTYHNFGNSDAVNATSSLSSYDAYVTLPTSTHLWPLIASNTSTTANDALSINIKNGVPDQHTAHFTLVTQADTNVFTNEFDVKINAPNLHNSDISIDDTNGGNGNGKVDPGETINIEVTTTNTGHCTSPLVITNLFVFGDYVTTNSTSHNIGTLAPGATGTSNFSFTVSPNAPIGATFSLFVPAVAGLYNSVSTLSPTIGPMVEDFETGNLMKYDWKMSGDLPWITTTSAQSEGAYSARSGEIQNGQKSEMYIEGHVFSNDSISFYRKVSTQNGHDFLKFYLDGVELGNWSGNKDWARVSFYIPAGNHKFSWAYEKDPTIMDLQDAVWVDYITFPSFSPTTAGPLAVNTISSPATICVGNSAQLYVFATGGTGVYSYNWSPSGTLDNPEVFNPTATPTETTTYNVEVTNKQNTINGSSTVTVVPAPAVPVISISTDHLISTAATGYQWYNSQGLIAGATSQLYYPTHTESYYVITSNNQGCQSEPSNAIYFGFVNTKTSVENTLSIYPNPFTAMLNIDYHLLSAGNVKIALYNSIGKEIAIIADGLISSGNHHDVYNGKLLPAGVYYCKIFSNEGVQIVKIVKN